MRHFGDPPFSFSNASIIKNLKAHVTMCKEGENAENGRDSGTCGLKKDTSDALYTTFDSCCASSTLRHSHAGQGTVLGHCNNASQAGKERAEGDMFVLGSMGRVHGLTILGER